MLVCFRFGLLSGVLFGDCVAFLWIIFCVCYNVGTLLLGFGYFVLVLLVVWLLVVFLLDLLFSCFGVWFVISAVDFVFCSLFGLLCVFV